MSPWPEPFHALVPVTAGSQVTVPDFPELPPTPPLTLSSAASSPSSWGWIPEAMPHLHMQGPKLDPGWTWDSTSPLMTEDVTKQGTGSDGKCHGAYLERNLMGARAQPQGCRVNQSAGSPGAWPFFQRGTFMTLVVNPVLKGQGSVASGPALPSGKPQLAGGPVVV